MTTTQGQVASLLTRIAVLMCAAWAVLLIDISDAHAQAASCSRLEDMLRTLDRNQDFQNSQSGNLRQLQRNVQRAESAYVRNGCNDDAKAGRQLSPQCRAMARDVLDGREQVERMSRSVDTGQAVAQQREAILQEMARFDCDRRSRVNVNRGGDRGNLFERLFGVFTEDGFDGEGGVRGDQFDPFGDYKTVRTLCVRKTDGFYWPISYSTLVDYVPNDAEQCRAMCPGLDVDLYYYDNPGQEPQQAINQWGEPYASLPTAFRFRTDFDTESKCNAMQDQGSIAVAEMFDGGTRAIVTFRGEDFPLPLRDARRRTTAIAAAIPVQAVDTAVYVDIPLPRRRPGSPGAAPAHAQAVAPVATPEARIVMFGDKRVRIVGPETPYGQLAATGI